MSRHKKIERMREIERKRRRRMKTLRLRKKEAILDAKKKKE
ncbi:MAG: hypothetical protein ACMUJM_01040 [bacterium]